jgi:hypothetical protein
VEWWRLNDRRQERPVIWSRRFVWKRKIADPCAGGNLQHKVAELAQIDQLIHRSPP